MLGPYQDLICLQNFSVRSLFVISDLRKLRYENGKYMQLVQDLFSDRFSIIDVESSGYTTIHVWSTINQFQALPVANEIAISYSVPEKEIRKISWREVS
jgi:hypothetical protein